MTTNLTPDQLIDKWVEHHDAETTLRSPLTLAQQVKREFAAHNWTIEGLADDATEERVLWFLEALLEELRKERAA